MPVGVKHLGDIAIAGFFDPPAKKAKNDAHRREFYLAVKDLGTPELQRIVSGVSQKIALTRQSIEELQQELAHQKVMLKSHETEHDVVSEIVDRRR